MQTKGHLYVYYMFPLMVSITRKHGFTQGYNERNIWSNSWSHYRIKWSDLLCHKLSEGLIHTAIHSSPDLTQVL
jgi:hypothetical protein